jgi:hypothetical protein
MLRSVDQILLVPSDFILLQLQSIGKVGSQHMLVLLQLMFIIPVEYASAYLVTDDKESMYAWQPACLFCRFFQCKCGFNTNFLSISSLVNIDSSCYFLNIGVPSILCI